MVNADLHHAHFMALTDIQSTLSEDERVQLVSTYPTAVVRCAIPDLVCVDTICFLIDSKSLKYSPSRNFNLITIKNTPGIWAGIPNAYRIDVTHHGRSIIFGNEVATRIEALEGLRQNVEKRARQATVSRSGAPNGRVLADDRQTEWPRHSVITRHTEPGYVDKGHDPEMHAAAAKARHGFTKRGEDVVLPPESGGGDVPRAIWRDNVHGGKVFNPGTADVRPVARDNHAGFRNGEDAEHLAAGNLRLKRKATVADETPRKKAETMNDGEKVADTDFIFDDDPEGAIPANDAFWRNR